MFRGGSPALGLLFIAVASVLLAGQGPVAVRVPADVRAKIESVINPGRAPSIAVALARDGRVVWSDAFGVADKTRRTPATPTTPYAVASLTKTFTATAVMVLSERGRMALDDPITEYLGAIVRPHVGSPSEVTLRRTLQNAAGFPVHAQWFQGSRLKYSCVVRTGEFSTLAFA